MKYFIANLCVHSALTLILVFLVIIFTNRNRKGQTKYALSYFMPLLFCALTIFYVFKFTGPRLLDLSSIAGKNYYSYTGTLEDISFLNNAFTVDGQKYLINPLWELPDRGSQVRIRYTRFSNFAIEVSLPEAVNVSDTITEEIKTTVQTEKAPGGTS